jgi:hypothetical protein
VGELKIFFYLKNGLQQSYVCMYVAVCTFSIRGIGSWIQW